LLNRCRCWTNLQAGPFTWLGRACLANVACNADTAHLTGGGLDVEGDVPPCRKPQRHVPQAPKHGFPQAVGGIPCHAASAQASRSRVETAAVPCWKVHYADSAKPTGDLAPCELETSDIGPLGQSGQYLRCEPSGMLMGAEPEICCTSRSSTELQHFSTDRTSTDEIPDLRGTSIQMRCEGIADARTPQGWGGSRSLEGRSILWTPP
jgi:hypothetical protein